MSESESVYPFWIKVNIHDGEDDETVKDLKELISTLRIKFLKESQKEMSVKSGINADSIRKYEEMKNKPYVSISLLKKICKAYGLKCELTIYNK